MCVCGGAMGRSCLLFVKEHCLHVFVDLVESELIRVRLAPQHIEAEAAAVLLGPRADGVLLHDLQELCSQPS